jgi:hypothetical protein
VHGLQLRVNEPKMFLCALLMKSRKKIFRCDKIRLTKKFRL